MTIINLEAFSEIIRCMDIKKNGCDVQYSTWKEFESGNKTLTNFNKTFFNGSTTKFISKEELFNLAKDPKKTEDFIIYTIYWGFSSPSMKAYRDNNFLNIISNLSSLVTTLDTVRNMNVKLMRFDIKTGFSGFKGISYATYSKFLFFLETQIYNNKCLILDSKIISKIKIFRELSEIHNITKENANEMYEKYVSEMNQVARKLGVEPKQLEAFIFKLKI